jgi:hypothetical protein
MLLRVIAITLTGNPVIFIGYIDILKKRHNVCLIPVVFLPALDTNQLFVVTYIPVLVAWKHQGLF